MVIVTGYKQKGAKLPSKRPFGAVYDIAREGLKYYGYYDKYNLRQYDPQVYVDKYTYKPHKRVAGKLGQILYGTQKKQNRFRTSSRKLYEKRSKRYILDNICYLCQANCNCKRLGSTNTKYRRRAKLYNQSNLGRTRRMRYWNFWYK